MLLVTNFVHAVNEIIKELHVHLKYKSYQITLMKQTYFLSNEILYIDIFYCFLRGEY